MLFFKLLLTLSLALDFTQAIISNNTCAPLPKDKRQLICQCSKHLQLRCSFSIDINRFESKDLDRTLKPIYYDDVSIARTSDPNDLEDINLNFELNKRRFSNNKKSFYLYFPNFNTLNSPYIRTTFNGFHYIPSYAFNDASTNEYKQIESVVFELPIIYDFGIDQNAFHHLEVTDSLLIEGPFERMTIHSNAFENSRINELIIGCYCIECESFDGSCKVLFNQASKYKQLAHSKRNSNSNSFIKSLKLFGVELIWDLDSLPGLDYLEKLEISNTKHYSNQHDYELKSNKVYTNLAEFYFKNNNLKNIAKLNIFKYYPNLKVLNLGQNRIENLEKNSFKSSFTHTELIEINLERNKIKKLNGLMFGENLSKLKILNLNQNQIDSVEDFTFRYLNNLESLDLTRNKLTSLDINTFYGLNNLKKLLLSYNPFKTFDFNTFKHVSTLKRLDIISNTETDWFNFDNNDICLLSYFKCETQINIDLDQRCNCFVKYTNLIASSESSEFKWFRPCATEDHGNLNRYFDDTFNFADELENKNNRDPSLYSTNNLQNMPKIECKIDQVQKCYSNMESLEKANSSCLYKKYVASKSNKNLEFKTELEISPTQSSADKSASQKFTNKDDDLIDDSNVTEYDLNKDLINNENEVNVNKYSKLVKQNQSLILNRFSIENSLIFVLIGIFVVFLISILSLFIGIYLVLNRNKFSYHTTDSSYPPDE